MQIRRRADLSREEAIMLLEASEVEVETLRQQLAELHAQMEAIGAGGVSSLRITGGRE